MTRLLLIILICFACFSVGFAQPPISIIDSGVNRYDYQNDTLLESKRAWDLTEEGRIGAWIKVNCQNPNDLGDTIYYHNYTVTVTSPDGKKKDTFGPYGFNMQCVGIYSVLVRDFSIMSGINPIGKWKVIFSVRNKSTQAEVVSKTLTFSVKK